MAPVLLFFSFNLDKKNRYETNENRRNILVLMLNQKRSNDRLPVSVTRFCYLHSALKQSRSNIRSVFVMLFTVSEEINYRKDAKVDTLYLPNLHYIVKFWWFRSFSSFFNSNTQDLSAEISMQRLCQPSYQETNNTSLLKTAFFWKT